MADERRRVEVGVGDHREDGARAGVERHDGTALVTQGLVGGLLDLGVDRQLEAGALGLTAGDGAGEPVVEELVVAAREQTVLRLLDPAAGTVGEGVPPGDVAVETRVAVGALPLQVVLGRGGAGDGSAPDEDLTALAGIALELGTPVAGPVVDVLRAEDLDPRARREQEHEEHGHEHREASDRLVHRVFTTWVGASMEAGSNSGSGRRAWSLMRSRIAMSVQLVSREDPP